MIFTAPLLLSLAAWFQSSEAAAGWPGDEGPLSNDCFAPTATEAGEHLALGDAAYAGGRPEAEVFDHWHDALAASEPGDSVEPRPESARAEGQSPWPDPDGTAGRRTEGVERSVLRRLHAIEPAQLDTWVGRFTTLADEQLTGAGQRAGALIQVERQHPATPGAARAALRLADLDFEAGHTVLAATWLDRAGEHTDLFSAHTPPDAFRAAIAARWAALAELRALDTASQGAPSRDAGAWRTATSLKPLGFVPLVRSPLRPQPTSPEPGPGVGLQPGMCLLADGTAAVQSAERIHLIDLEAGEARGDVIPAMLFEGANWIAGDPVARATQPPGWPLLPMADGNAVIAVQGRTVERSRNALVCIEIGTHRVEGPPPAELRWALRGDELLRGGRVESSGLGLSQIEFQPGLARLGTRLFVQVREAFGALGDRPGLMSTEEQVPSWLVAVDVTSGQVVWKRFLAKGLPYPRSDTRFGISLAAPVSAAQPLTTAGDRIFAGTHLGLGALVEADGRVVWSFKNRRRPAEAPGWSGWTPVSIPAAGDGGEAVLWAPADSDHLYTLATGEPAALEPAALEPDGAGHAGPLLGSPRNIREAEVLLGGDRAEAIVLSRAGRERNASAWQLTTGGRHDAPFLGPGERFTGHGLVSNERALFATQRGLVLLDRTRELFLLDYAPLSRPELAGLSIGTASSGRRAGRSVGASAVESGGSVQAFGQRVAVVGPLGVWLFAAE